MQKSNPFGKHLVRYGIAADQKYLLGEFLDAYDQLVINASMVAHQSAALAMFITQRAKNKPYFIDPQTHAFQHEVESLQSTSLNSEGEIKKSFKKLIEQYGNPIEEQIIENKQSIFPEDFLDNKLRRGFCRRVIRYQREAISDHAKESDAAPYYKFLKEEGISDFNSFTPSIVVAPYFYMESLTLENWLDVNIACANDSVKIADKNGYNLGIQIVIAKDILFDESQVEQLIDAYSKVQASVFLIWVDAFDECSVSEKLLEAYISFIKGLKNNKVPVISLYGGYFSVLLMHRNLLDGITHSLEYGEQRPVKPVGGGIPVAKFYLPCLHNRLQFRDAYRAVLALNGTKNKEAFIKNICGCAQCKKLFKSNDVLRDFTINYGKTKLIKGRQYPIPETKDNSVRHYMWCKSKEYRRTTSIKKLIEQLEETSKNKKLKRAVRLENFAHCEKWVNVLKGIK